MLFLLLPLFVAAFFLGVVAALRGRTILASRLRLAGLRRELQEAAASLGAACSGDAFSAVIGGLPLTVRIIRPFARPCEVEISASLDEVTREPPEGPGGYRSSPALKVRGRPRVAVHRSTPLSRLGERLRILQKPSTGEPAFDAAFWLETDASAEDTGKVLADQRARQALLRLREEGVHSIAVNEVGSSLSARIRDVKEEQLNVFTLGEVAEGLSSAAPALPIFEGGAGSSRRSLAIRLLWGITVAAALSAPILPWVAWKTWPPLEPRGPLEPGVFSAGAVMGVGLWMLAFALIARLFRGRPGFGPHLFAVAVALFPALPAHGAFALSALNSLLDTTYVDRLGFVSAVTSRIDPTYRRYYVSVTWWEKERPNHTSSVGVEAPRSFYAVAEQCPIKVILTTGNGRFGWDWFRGVRCAPPGDQSRYSDPPPTIETDWLMRD